MSCASIRRTGSSFFTASSIARSLRRSGRAEETFRELVRELGREVSARQDRGSAQAAARPPLRRPASAHASLGTVAAYWASLGLSPRERGETISRNAACAFNRSTCRAQRELGAALRELGVRVVKRSADLTVTLVSDYLEATAGRIEPAALVGSCALAARPALRHLSPGRAGVQPGQERLLGLPCRADDSAIARSRRSSTAERRAVSPLRRSPATRSDRAASSLLPSRSQKRSPPAFAPTCAITSSASICWARPS